MSVQLIQQYYARVEQMIRYGRTRNGSTLRKPLQDLLEQYARSKNLVLVPEVDTVTSLRGVPAEAWESRLGTYSVLEWVLERYKESVLCHCEEPFFGDEAIPGLGVTARQCSSAACPAFFAGKQSPDGKEIASGRKCTGPRNDNLVSLRGGDLPPPVPRFLRGSSPRVARRLLRAGSAPALAMTRKRGDCLPLRGTSCSQKCGSLAMTEKSERMRHGGSRAGKEIEARRGGVE